MSGSLNMLSPSRLSGSIRSSSSSGKPPSESKHSGTADRALLMSLDWLGFESSAGGREGTQPRGKWAKTDGGWQPIIIPVTKGFWNWSSTTSKVTLNHLKEALLCFFIFPLSFGELYSLMCMWTASKVLRPKVQGKGSDSHYTNHSPLTCLKRLGILALISMTSCTSSPKFWNPVPVYKFLDPGLYQELL